MISDRNQSSRQKPGIIIVIIVIIAERGALEVCHFPGATTVYCVVGCPVLQASANTCGRDWRSRALILLRDIQ